MGNLKLSLYLAVVITIFMMLRLSAARSHGARRHFQDSLEYGGEFDVDERPLNGRGHRGHRNHRGRFGGHHLGHDVVHLFHKGLPLLNPTKGPAQSPLILPSHPNRGFGLHQNHNQNPAPMTNNNLPQQLPAIPETHSQFINQPEQQPQPNPYELNPFQWNVQTPSEIPKNRDNLAPLSNRNLPQQLPPIPETHSQIINQPVQQPQPNPNEVNPFQWNVQTPSDTPINRENPTVTNQLPASDKPLTTTPNPRLTDLLYGSNLFEEENNNNSNLRGQTVRRDAIW